MLKRTLSLVLCIVMVLSMLPFQTMAAENTGLTNADANVDQYFNGGVATAAVGDRRFVENENNNTKSRANRVYNDYTVSGTMVSGNTIDYYKFVLTKRSYVSIAAVASYTGLTLRVYNASGYSVGSSNGYYRNGYYNYGLTGTLSAGTYYIKFSDYGYNVYTFYFSSSGAVNNTVTAPSISVTRNTSTGKPIISWSRVSNAKKYEIYRATSRNGSYTKIKTLSYTKSTYTDTTAKAGTNYYYKIKTVGSNGKKSGYSNIDYIRCKLAAPVPYISLYRGDPKLTWNKVAGAKKYEIYRSTSLYGTYRRVKVTTARAVIDLTCVPGRTYYYRVVAVCSPTSGNSAASVARGIIAR